ncbi:MAG: hypothetical protein Fur0025_46610 [Oscillatoriaceae cyanobacterium]
MPQEPKLPDFNFWRRNNPRSGRKSASEPQDQIVWADAPQNQQITWEESDDVYKPIPKKMKDFQLERGIEGEYIKRVYIKADALDNLTAHLSSNLRVEQGGILFGNAYEDPAQGIYVEITAAVAAPATIGTGAHLEFTPDSWLGIMDDARHQHPRQNIVGWYHSHPNIGVFMSGTDMRTQQAFFYHPWCLSIVYDPVRLDIGYFLGENAQSVQPVIWPHRMAVRGTEPPISTDITGLPVITQGQPLDPEDDTPKTQSGAITHTTPKKKGYPLVVVVVVAALLGVVMGVIGTTIFSNHSSNPSTSNPVAAQTSQVNVSILTMPVKVFRELQQETLLKYPVVDPPMIGGGDEVVLLVISLPDQIANASNFELDIQEMPLRPDVPLADKAGIIKYLTKPADSLTDPADIRNTNDSTYNLYSHQPITIPLDNLNNNLGVFIPIGSYHPATANDNNDKTKNTKNLRNVIYIPRQLKYRDEKNNLQQIDIQRLIKNG